MSQAPAPNGHGWVYASPPPRPITLLPFALLILVAGLGVLLFMFLRTPRATVPIVGEVSCHASAIEVTFSSPDLDPSGSAIARAVEQQFIDNCKSDAHTDLLIGSGAGLVGIVGYIALAMANRQRQSEYDHRYNILR